MTATQATLLLEDGTKFTGRAIGKIGSTSGEICFNTGMTGYQEIFTDPSYFGQILVQTNVHIGNYGAFSKDTESDSVKIAGLVCKTFSGFHSRKMAESTLDDYFINNNVIGIQDVDTRELVRHVRDKGVMNVIISSEISDEKELMKELKKVPSMKGLELASAVTTKQFYTFGKESARYKVAVIDLGVKTNILRSLDERDCFCGVFNAKTDFNELMKFEPDGILVSNGPGDPAVMPYAVDTVAKCLEKNIPMFGICLGIQMIGQAVGAKTFKMFNGHRGLNHPVKNLISGRSEVTSQNHGFALVNEKNDRVEITHMNLNDNTIEGIRIKGKKAFAVQYHPESSPGPHDSRYLFDDFIALMKK